MRKLTKITAATLAAAAALGGAGIASAHPGYGDYGRPAYSDFNRETSYRTQAIRGQLDDLARRVDRNDRRDLISEREAAGLRREIGRTREQLHWMNRDGLDHRELRRLQARIDDIRFQLHDERRDWDGRRG